MAKNIFSLTNHEVFLITASHDDEHSGFIATWVLPASLLPGTPRMMCLVSPLNYTWELIQKSGTFVLHLLDEHQLELLPSFALKSGKDTDKFKGVDWRQEKEGPIITGACGYATCKLTKTFDIGERIVVVGDVVKHFVDPQKNPLTKREAFDRLPEQTAQELKELHTHLGEASAQLFRADL